MPAVIPLAIALGTAGGTVGAAKIASKSAQRAGAIQQQYGDKAFDYEVEQDRIEREQYAQEYARKIELEEERRKYEAEDRRLTLEDRARRDALDAQRYGLDRERLGIDKDRLGLDQTAQNWTFQQRADLLERMAPYRQFGEAGMKKLSGLL